MSKKELPPIAVVEGNPSSWPSDEALLAFAEQGCTDKDCWIDKDLTITICKGPSYVEAIRCLIASWCWKRKPVGVMCRPNHLGRFEAAVVRPHDIQNVPPKTLCEFTADREGDAVLRAIIKYEQSLAGENDNKALPASSIILEP